MLIGLRKTSVFTSRTVAASESAPTLATDGNEVETMVGLAVIVKSSAAVTVNVYAYTPLTGWVLHTAQTVATEGVVEAPVYGSRWAVVLTVAASTTVSIQALLGPNYG